MATNLEIHECDLDEALRVINAFGSSGQFNAFPVLGGSGVSELSVYVYEDDPSKAKEMLSALLEQNGIASFSLSVA